MQFNSCDPIENKIEQNVQQFVLHLMHLYILLMCINQWCVCAKTNNIIFIIMKIKNHSKKINANQDRFKLDSNSI